MSNKELIFPKEVVVVFVFFVIGGSVWISMVCLDYYDDDIMFSHTELILVPLFSMITLLTLIFISIVFMDLSKDVNDDETQVY